MYSDLVSKLGGDATAAGELTKDDEGKAQDATAAASAVAAAAAAAAANRPRIETVSKTQASQAESGSNSYYYWLSKVPQGDCAAPKPTPKLLATEAAKSGPTSSKAISSYSLLDEGDEVLKVYVPLEGELDQVNTDSIEAEFSTRSITITLTTPSTLHKLHVPTLMNEILPEKCKTRVTKSRKLIITLAKRDVSRTWKALRAF